MKSFILTNGFLHFMFAFLLLPVQNVLPEVIKLAFIPYILFLLFKKDPVYLPALIALITPGTTIAYGILISILIFTIVNINSLRKRGLGLLLLFALLPFPIFAYMTYIRITEMNLGLIQSLTPLGYYLGLFPFFYGVMLSNKFTQKAFYGVVLVLFLLPLYQYTGLLESSVRIYWLSFPLFFSINLYILLFKSTRKELLFPLGLMAFFFIVSNPTSKFTLIFASLVSFLVLYFKYKGRDFFLSLFTKKRTIFVFTLIVISLIYYSEASTRNLASQNIDYNELGTFDSWESFKSKLWYKAFGDRSVIWLGAWETILNSDYLYFPPYEDIGYSFVNYKGDNIEDTEISSHNIAIELMRNYGVSVGLLIFLIYFLMMIKGPGNYILKSNNKIFIVLAAVCIGTGFVGGLVGQYVLMITFSVGLLTLFGLFYGLGLAFSDEKRK
jgi:hypothetical protein